MQRFSPHPDGVQLTLPPEEAEALRMVPELLASVGESSDDPAAGRLAIVTYPDDDEAEDEFTRLMRSEIDAGRVADRSALETSLDAAATGSVVLSFGEAEAWLIVLNEARLALAARLGIEDDGWEDEVEDDEITPPMAFLDYLTYLHGELTVVLMESL